jgi:glycosyltransferase involved in cell wall biosynthesis
MKSQPISTETSANSGPASMPLVSLVTPVYNDAEYLAECIESVLAQTYQNWDYTIVDNCSTDESLAIAQKYALTDARIRVVRNTTFLRIIENHNHSIRQISPESRYCKFIFADDWMYQNCVEEMVKVAEQNPSVGLVSSYAMDGQSVLWPGPSYPCYRASGRDVCRSKLLGGPYFFGTPTCLLMRSDLVRKRAALFNARNLHADMEACFDLLQESDFGFVHQVLTFSRPRAKSNASFAKDFDSYILGEVVLLLKFGPIFLDESEFQKRRKRVLRDYHYVLANSVLLLRSREFWKYHQETLSAFGSRIEPWYLALAILAQIANKISRPIEVSRNCWHRADRLFTSLGWRRALPGRRLPDDVNLAR